jgi:type I restriction enzyme M protein
MPRSSGKTVQKNKTTHELQTTAQTLGSLIKSCRDIMRKDKGLTTDLDRLPMLTWIMFLKFLDDMEQVREAEAKLEGKRFRLALEPPYRWRDWAAKPDGITGDALISFINNEEAVRPDGSRGPGLFAYLRSLQGANGGDRRDVIRTVFQGTVNRMINGYLLRDVINKVGGIRFTSTEEIYTLGHLYESMLKEMRDAAGENGEFYTPRPVVQFIVTVVSPRLGETVLDPACGTGGFLAAAFEHLKKQCQTAEDHRRLHRETLFGIEAKPLPYLLCQMNLLLHGFEIPNIDPLNALRFPLREIGDRDRVDIIITNPPFGGEEERGILGNFPEDMQTAETALLFLQLIMRKLRRPVGGKAGGRCGMVVPNGTLFGDGVCARIKEQLLKEFNLHTIVRLPNGVFAPYTGIPTNLLFFDRAGPTKEIWYYEQPLPEGRKQYTKTQPLRFEEFADCIAWWKNRKENDRAWKVKVESILKYDADGKLLSCNLDLKNPNAKADFEHLPLDQLAADILAKEQRIADIVVEIKKMVEGVL